MQDLHDKRPGPAHADASGSHPTPAGHAHHSATPQLSRVLRRFSLLLCCALVLVTAVWALSGAAANKKAASVPPVSAAGEAGAGPVPQPLDGMQLTQPDTQRIEQPQNGRVLLAYFDTVTFLGDSLTQGLMPSEYNVLPGAKYCAYVGVSIRAFYNGTEFENAAGDPEKPMEALAASQPDNVYILLGANDMMNRTDEAIVENYETLIAAVRQTVHPAVGIYIQSLTPVAADAERFDMNRIRALNDRLAWMAYQTGCHFIDLMEPLAGPDGYLRAEYNGGDGYHLNFSGYRAWVDYLATHTAYNPRNPYIEGSPYRAPSEV